MQANVAVDTLVGFDCRVKPGFDDRGSCNTHLMSRIYFTCSRKYFPRLIMSRP